MCCQNMFIIQESIYFENNMSKAGRKPSPSHLHLVFNTMCKLPPSQKYNVYWWSCSAGQMKCDLCFMRWKHWLMIRQVGRQSAADSNPRQPWMKHHMADSKQKQLCNNVRFHAHLPGVTLTHYQQPPPSKTVWKEEGDGARDCVWREHRVNL